MSWKSIHRWLGLVLGTLALVLGLTGTLLAVNPLQQAWQAPTGSNGLSVAGLVQRVERTIPGIEEMRHLPSGVVVVYSFDNDQARAVRVNPTDGTVLGPYQPSALPRWVKNLHRTLLLTGNRYNVTAAGLPGDFDPPTLFKPFDVEALRSTASALLSAALCRHARPA